VRDKIPEIIRLPQDIAVVAVHFYDPDKRRARLMSYRDIYIAVSVNRRGAVYSRTGEIMISPNLVKGKGGEVRY
jgi:hypothetical protein